MDEAKKLEYKNLGNKHFVAKEYGYAICQYSSALLIDLDDIDVLSNRALTYNHMGSFSLGLEDAEKVLKTNPSHRKCNFRKVKSLWGLGRFDDALDFLRTKVSDELMKTDEFVNLIPTTETLLRQSKGDFDMQDLYFDAAKVPKGQSPDIAEYTAALEIAPEIPEKGRRLVAKADFNIGDLLICSRAFQIVYSDDGDIEKTIKQLTVNTFNKLFKDPSSREPFSKLYSGPETPKRKNRPAEWLLTDEPYNKLGTIHNVTCDNEREEGTEVIEEIRNRCHFNMFGLNEDSLTRKPFYGVWILPSYLNHSCVDANAYWSVYGDIFFLRAIKPIKAGEEVMVSYLRTPSDPFAEAAFSFHEFRDKIHCQCRLCKFEWTWLEEPVEGGDLTPVQKQTKAVIELVDGIKSRLEKTDKRTLKAQIADIKKIIALRSDNPTLNMDLVDPEVRKVCDQLITKGRMFKEAAEIYEAMWNVASASGFVELTLGICIFILRCHIQLGNSQQIVKWRKQCKLDRIAGIGTDKLNPNKIEGDVFFRAGDIGQAIKCYNIALMLDHDSLDIISNRAIAYLTMGCYELALKDTEKVLKENPTHAKCLLRKVKSLLGLARFDEALEFLKTSVPKELLEEQPFSELIPQAEKMQRQSKGDYDMLEMMKLPQDKCNEVAEYTGPVEIVPIPGKGRGVRATADISAGQLIICSKAFCFLAKKYPRQLPLSIEFGMRMFVELVLEIRKKFHLDPNAREAYCKLDPGPETKRPAGWLKKQCEVFYAKTNAGFDEELTDDMNDEIKQRAFFCGTGPIQPFMEGRLLYGLWLLPSYINHSCLDCNANFKPYGDIAMIRALRDIKKGEEITIAYCSPCQQREIPLVMQKHQFVCNCKLCETRRTDSPKTKKAIEDILKDIRDNIMHTDEAKLTAQIQSVKKLVALRKDNPRVNVELMDQAIVQLSRQLLQKKMWEEAAYLFEESFKVCRNTAMVGNAVNLSECVMHCYMEMGDKPEQVEKWETLFHEARIVASGVNIPDCQEFPDGLKI